MLALNSPSWTDYETFFGSPDELPTNFQAWRGAFGTSDEETAWNRLRDQFLCQSTIKDSAIAIVPHICRLLPTTTTTLRHYYASDIGQVHIAWRRDPIGSVSPELISCYEASIASIRLWACECLTRPLEHVDFRYLLSACSALCEHTGLGRFLFTLDSLPDEFPDLVGYV